MPLLLFFCWNHWSIDSPPHYYGTPSSVGGDVGRWWSWKRLRDGSSLFRADESSWPALLAQLPPVAPSARQCTNSDLKKLSPPLALRTWPYRPLQYRFLPPFWIFLFLFLFVRSIWSSIFWLKNQYRIKGECKYPLFLPVYFIPITQSLVDGRVQFPLFYSPVCGQREQERASLLGPYSLSTSLPSISWTEASNDIAPAGGSTSGWMGKRGNSCRDQKFFGIERQTRIRLCYEMRLHPQTLIVFSFSVFSG